MREVKNRRRRGRTRVSSKHQITVPVDALRAAGISPGDELEVEAVERGRIVLARADDPLRRFAGSMTGVYPPGYLDRLRDEWA